MRPDQARRRPDCRSPRACPCEGSRPSIKAVNTRGTAGPSAAAGQAFGVLVHLRLPLAPTRAASAGSASQLTGAETGSGGGRGGSGRCSTCARARACGCAPRRARAAPRARARAPALRPARPPWRRRAAPLRTGAAPAAASGCARAAAARASATAAASACARRSGVSGWRLSQQALPYWEPHAAPQPLPSSYCWAHGFNMLD